MARQSSRSIDNIYINKKSSHLHYVGVSMLGLHFCWKFRFPALEPPPSLDALPLIRGVTLVFTLLAAFAQLSRDYHTLNH